MVADEKLPGERERAVEEPLLSPLRALALFVVGLAVLLGVGGLLLSQLSRARGGATGASVEVGAAVASVSAPTSVLQPTPASTGGPLVIQTSDTPRRTVPPAADVATPAEQQGLAASPDATEVASMSGREETGPSGVQRRAAERTATQAEAPEDLGARQPDTERALPPPTELTAAATAPEHASHLPVSANLGGSLIPVGPEGVMAQGAVRFAQALAQRARTVAGRPLSDEGVLDDLARRVLTEQLAGARERGYPQGDVVQRDGATVRVELVAALPHTNGVVLTSLPKDTQAVGVAVGVAQRMEPGYLPDLVVVAAVSYR